MGFYKMKFAGLLKTYNRLRCASLATTAFLSCGYQNSERALEPESYSIQINPAIIDSVGRQFIDSLLASPRHPGSKELVRVIDTLPDIAKRYFGIGGAWAKGVIYVSVDSKNIAEWRRRFEKTRTHPAELATIRGILAHEIGHKYTYPNTEEQADSFALANLPEMKMLYRNLIRRQKR